VVNSDDMHKELINFFETLTRTWADRREKKTGLREMQLNEKELEIAQNFLGNFSRLLPGEGGENLDPKNLHYLKITRKVDYIGQVHELVPLILVSADSKPVLVDGDPMCTLFLTSDKKTPWMTVEFSMYYMDKLSSVCQTDNIEYDNPLAITGTYIENCNIPVMDTKARFSSEDKPPIFAIVFVDFSGCMSDYRYYNISAATLVTAE